MKVWQQHSETQHHPQQSDDLLYSSKSESNAFLELSRIEKPSCELGMIKEV